MYTIVTHKNIYMYTSRSPCSFKRKQAFILLSSLASGKSLTLCTCTHSPMRANDEKIMCNGDAQCNTEESKTNF